MNTTLTAPASKASLLITVSGPDRPGITYKLMEVLAKDDHRILDIGQAVTHGLLSLSIVVDAGQGHEQQHLALPLIKDLLYEAKKLGLALDFKLVEEADFTKNAADTFILSCVSQATIPATFLRDLSQLLSSNNINIQRIDNIGEGDLKSLEMFTCPPPQIEWEKLKAELLNIGDRYSIDLAFLRDNIFRRNKRLIVFDMDSTLIQTEVIDEMAQVHGVGEQVKEITHRAMNGEIDFTSSLIQRVQLLKGLKKSQMYQVLQNLKLTDGAQEFIATVKHLGYKVALISGGFSFFALPLKQRLGLNYAFANELEWQGDELTGRVMGGIIDPEQKALLLDLITQQENLSLEQVVAIGDGANDLPMLARAGLGIAYHAKDIVKKKAQQRMSFGPMTTILYFLGIPAHLVSKTHDGQKSLFL